MTDARGSTTVRANSAIFRDIRVMTPIGVHTASCWASRSAGLALCAALVFGSLDRLSLRAAEANVDFLLSQLRNTIEANVGLGLPLAGHPRRPAPDGARQGGDQQVLAIEVFSPTGVSLFNTDRGSVGEPDIAAVAWKR